MRVLALALAVTSTLVMVAPLAAQAPAAGYDVALAQPVAQPTAVRALGEVTFRCEADRCVADGASFGRTVDVCVDLARRVGPVTRFAVRGRPTDERMVARCDARAGHG